MLFGYTQRPFCWYGGRTAQSGCANSTLLVKAVRLQPRAWDNRLPLSATLLHYSWVRQGHLHQSWYLGLLFFGFQISLFTRWHGLSFFSCSSVSGGHSGSVNVSWKFLISSKRSLEIFIICLLQPASYYLLIWRSLYLFFVILIDFAWNCMHIVPLRTFIVIR